MSFHPGLVAASPLAAAGGGGPVPIGPAYIGYVADSDAHPSYVRTRAVLDANGHSYTHIYTPTQSNPADYSAYDLVMIVRASGFQSLSDRIFGGLKLHSKPGWWSTVDAGITAGTGKDNGASNAALWSLNTVAANSVIDMECVNNAHPITSVFSLGDHAVYVDDNYSALAEGAVPGTVLFRVNGMPALTAIDANENDLAGNPVPARMIVGTIPYAGQGDYTAMASALIERGIQWLRGAL